MSLLILLFSGGVARPRTSTKNQSILSFQDNNTQSFRASTGINIGTWSKGL